MRHALVLVAALCLTTLSSAAPTQFVLDDLTSLDSWEATGRRINYTLGDTTLTASDDAPAGKSGSLALTYDFSIVWRGWLGLRWTGGRIPGVCESLTFDVKGDASGHGLQVRVIDAVGASYEKRLGALDGEMWEEVTVGFASEDKWRQLARHAEERHPMVFPITLDSIAVTQTPGAAAEGTVLFADLRVESDIEPLDLLELTVTPTLTPPVFYPPEPVRLNARIENPTDTDLFGTLSLRVRDFWGEDRLVLALPILIAAGETMERALAVPEERLGAYDVTLSVTSGERSRSERARFSVSEERTQPSLDPDSPFGVMCFIAGFPVGPAREQALKLCAEAGVRWERSGFNWQWLEPVKGAFAWGEPTRIDGPSGRAVEFEPGTRRFVIPNNESLNAPASAGELTIELRIRLPELDLSMPWHTILAKQLIGAPSREFYIYYAADPRRFALSLGDQEQLWSDIACEKTDWEPGRWYHLLVTHKRDGETRWYVDGLPSGGGRATRPTLLKTDGALAIGPTATGFAFALDDLRIYDRVLAPNQAADRAQGLDTDTAPIARYDFEDEDESIRDSVGESDGALAPSPTDSVVADCRRHGISVLGLVGFPPRWASTAPADTERFSLYEPDPAQFENYCREVAARYKGRVDHWEIWNEPNISVFWEPEPNADAYARTLAAGYRGCKTGNPDCNVLGVSLAGGAWPRLQFVEDVFAAGGGANMDLLSLHPYRQPRTPEATDLTGDMQDAADITRKYESPKQLWLTEIGWPTQMGRHGSSEAFEALMVPRSFIEAFACDAVDKVLWFRFHDGGWDPSYMEHHTGLVRRDLTPKPAYFAYRSMALALEGQRLARRLDAGLGVRAYVFEGDGKRTLALWAPDESVPVAVSGLAEGASRIDLMGNAHPVAARDGVSLVSASPAVQYVPGVPVAVKVVRLATFEPSQVMAGRGETASATLHLANPSGVDQEVALSLQAPEGVTTEAPGRVAIPAGGSTPVTVSIEVSDGAPIGRHEVAFQFTSPAGDFEATLPVIVTLTQRDAPPVVLLHFDEEDGDIAANAGSAEQPARLLGGARFSSAGKRGGCLELPEVASRAELPDAAPLTIADEITLMFWVRSSGPNGNWQSPIMKAIGERLRNYGVYLSRDTGEVHFTTTFDEMGEGHADPGCKTVVWDGDWHHVAVTFSKYGQRLRIYVDGAKVDEQRATQGGLMATPAPLVIGHGMGGPAPDGAQRPPAYLDELAIYARALSVDEIRAAVR